MIRYQRFHIVCKRNQSLAICADALEILQKMCLFDKHLRCRIAPGFICCADAHHADTCNALLCQFRFGTEPLGVIDAADEAQKVPDFAGYDRRALTAHFAHDRVSAVDVVIGNLFGLNFCERLVVSRALLCAIPRTLRRAGLSAAGIAAVEASVAVIVVRHLYPPPGSHRHEDKLP